MISDARRSKSVHVTAIFTKIRRKIVSSKCNRNALKLFVKYSDIFIQWIQ